MVWRVRPSTFCSFGVYVYVGVRRALGTRPMAHATDEEWQRRCEKQSAEPEEIKRGRPRQTNMQTVVIMETQPTGIRVIERPTETLSFAILVDL